MIKKISNQLMIVLLVSLVAGMTFNHFNSSGIPILQSGSAANTSVPGSAKSPDDILSKADRTLALAEAYVLFQSNSAVFVDARPPSFYQTEHIKNAISVYYKTAGLNPALNRLEKNNPYVVYCKGPNCNQAQLLVTTMRKAGFTKIFLFPGGMQEWRLAQYPMDRTP